MSLVSHARQTASPPGTHDRHDVGIPQSGSSGKTVAAIGAFPYVARRSIRRVVSVVLATMLLAAAPVEADNARHAWTVPGTLRIALITSPDTLNPILTTSSAESFIDSLIFDGLVYALPDGIAGRSEASHPARTSGSLRIATRAALRSRGRRDARYFAALGCMCIRADRRYVGVVDDDAPGDRAVFESIEDAVD